MALGVTFSEKDGMLFVSGWLDEHADLQPILASTAPTLKLNLRNIRAINSLGIRRFIDMMRTLGNRPLEFHECSPIFIETVNTVPLSVGGQKRVGRIKSAIVPMTCEDGHKTTIMTPIADLKVVANSVQMPRTICGICGSPLALENGMDADDYFFFLIARP